MKDEVLTPKKARLLSGKSQRQMAALMNIHEHTYRKIEKHPETMTIRQAIQFCSIVEREADDIYFGSDSSLIRVKGGEVYGSD